MEKKNSLLGLKILFAWKLCALLAREWDRDNANSIFNILSNSLTFWEEIKRIILLSC